MSDSVLSAGTPIQIVTPLPPSATGIAQYSRDLLLAVDGAWPIDVYPEEAAEDPGFASIRIRGRHRRRSLDPQLPTILHVGNSAYHEFAYSLARRRGAIMVLHDVVLHFGRLAEFLKHGKSSDYKREMRERYGEEGVRFAGQLLAGRRPESFVEFPLCEEFVERSSATIVHSEHARSLVQRLVPSASVYRVPMGVPLPALIDQSIARRALGIPEEMFVVASITHINPFKRIPVVLEALRHVVRDVPNTMFIIAGSVAPGMDIEALVSRLGLQRHVRVLGYVADDYARTLARAADVAINLRHPNAGETSASLLRLLGAGRPVMVTGDASMVEYHTEGVLRIPVDIGEIEAIRDGLVRMATDRDERTARGDSARAFIEREHSLASAIEGYRAVIALTSRRIMPLVTEVPLDEPVPVIAYHSAGAVASEPPSGVENVVADALITLRLDEHGDTIVSLAKCLVDLQLDPSSHGQRHGGSSLEDTLPISRELLDMLACPACKSDLNLRESELVCTNCRRRYPIEDGIPVLLVEE